MAKKNSAARTEASQKAAAIRQAQEAGERRRRNVVVTVVVVVLLTLVLGIWTALRAAEDTTGQKATAPKGADGYVLPFGNADAGTTVTAFEDFMCPVCGVFEEAVSSDLQQAIDGGTALVEFHVMSFLDDQSSTRYSTRAGNAFAVVYDVAGEDAAKKFHDLLYQNQPAEGSAGLSDAKLVELAKQAGASQPEVAAGIESLKFEQWVKNANDAASKDGVSSTPTVKVDGKTVEFTTIEELAANVAEALRAG